MKKFVLNLLMIFGIIAITEAQTSISNVTFKGGERIRYDVYYNWGIIWLHAGNANFKVSEINYQNTPSYKFAVDGHSVKSFDSFFHVRDTMISIARQNDLLPYYHKRVSRENNYFAEDIFNFTETGKNTKVIRESKRKNNRHTIDTLSFDKTVTDVISVIYRLRNLNFDTMKVNHKHPFSVIVDNDMQESNLHVRYLGKEVVKLKNGKEFNCIKISPQLIKGNFFRGEEGMTIWISDDTNRIPIYIESKIRVGSVKLMLTDFENLRHSFGAEKI